MFDWLEDEIDLIRTKKFHLIDGPADQSLRDAIENSELAVPNSYKAFVLRFGNVKLYRQLDYYKVGVLASPREETYAKSGEIYYRFGHYDSSSAYFKESLLRADEETPVFEGHGGGFQKIADGFESWLLIRCIASRKTFNKDRWQAIVSGPAPFTVEEKSIVEARRLYSWRVVGISPNRNLLVEVHNGSEMILPFYSVGVRWKTSETLGGIKIPVADVLPRQTSVIEQDAYKEMVDPSLIDLFQLPDPEPEDRDRYWEFKARPV